MARHLAICERKSAYPSRKDAKSAIVTHSMLDVLGLVRKPEEGPSGIKKSPSFSVDHIKEKETVVIEDNEASVKDQADSESENKEASDKMDVETDEIVAIDLEEYGKTDDEVEERKRPEDGEEKEENDEVKDKNNENDEEVKETSKEAENETGAASEEVKESNDERANQAEDNEKVDEEDKESNEKINEHELEIKDKEVEEREKATEQVEGDKLQESESGGDEITEVAASNSPELEKSEELQSEVTSVQQATEKGETSEDNAVEDSSEKQDTEVKSPESVSQETGLDREAPVEEKSVSPVPPEQPDEQEPAHESYSPPLEKMSPANDVESTEGIEEKRNAMDSEITSDDIQNMISDVVGDKSNSEVNFSDVRNAGETQNMETETENIISSQVEDTSMQIIQDESMEALQNSNDVVMESDITPMETD